jgi:hypothetical protein
MKRLRILMVIVVFGLAFPVSPSPASAYSLGSPPAGAPLLPIAVPLIVVQQLEEDQGWEMHDNLAGEFCYTAENGQQYCIEDPGAPHAAQ